MIKCYNYFDGGTKPEAKNTDFIRFNVRKVATAIQNDPIAQDAFETILAQLQAAIEIAKTAEFKIDQLKLLIKDINSILK